MRTFVDLSHLNPITSLDALKGSGISGIILKGQEGVTYQDPLYSKRVMEMKDAGIPILSEYIYYHPEDDPGGQVENVKQNCQDVKDVMVDLEWLKGGQAWQGTEAVNESNLKVFTALLEIAGFHVRIYTSQAFVAQCLPDANWMSMYDLWVAWYEAGPPALPSMWTTWWGWQYTCKGNVPGVSSYVDVSYLNDNAVA